MMFVDTSGWYAAYVPTDPHHSQVKQLIDNADSRLVTTDHVLSEALTLLRVRNEYPRSLLLGAHLLSKASTELIHVTTQDIEQAWIVFSKFQDKAWSFVDCTSFVIMQRLGIHEAISLDKHFHQMPGITVFP